MKQSVEVKADVQGVQTTAEISQTVSTEEIRNLPILDRDVLSVIQTQPGVVNNGNSYTVINGLADFLSSDVTWTASTFRTITSATTRWIICPISC